MGLKFPHDLEAWQVWEKKQNLLRYLSTKLKKRAEHPDFALVLALRPEASAASVLIALEAITPTQLVALFTPGFYLEKLGKSVAVLAPKEQAAYLKDQGFTEQVNLNSTSNLPGELGRIREVIAAGHYLPVGEWAYTLACQQGWTFNVVQHGLLTPYAPPLPKDSTLLAFSEADAEFWISGRSDITSEVVGSQLFFEAAQQAQLGSTTEVSDGLVFLGQMHGAELPRLSFAKSSYEFCQKNGAVYRPHPSERDKISTLTHKLWAKKGIKIDTSARPLNQSNTPVVSIFSTGVLEAAIRGVPSWVYHSNPPAWLKEFWDRYGMKQWGGEPTAAPAQPELEPALAIAQYIAHRLEK